MIHEYTIKVLRVNSYSYTFNRILLINKLPASTKEAYSVISPSDGEIGGFKSLQAAYRACLQHARKNKYAEIRVCSIVEYKDKVEIYKGAP